MFAHLFSWRAKCAHSGGKSAQPPFPPLPVLILGQKFLCKSPQNLCIFKILIWIFPYFTLWHTQLFSERQCIRSPEKSCIHLIRHTEHRDLKTNICCFLSDIQVYVFTFWGRKALFFGVNLFPPSKRGPSAAWGRSGRYPASSTQPPGTISAVFWPQNHTEQLVLSSVISLPTIINWCFREITKWEGFFFIGL